MVKRKKAIVRKDEVISVRFPAGTVKDIQKVSKVLYFSRSISDYVKECVLCNLIQDKTVTDNREEIKNG